MSVDVCSDDLLNLLKTTESFVAKLSIEIVVLTSRLWSR